MFDDRIFDIHHQTIYDVYFNFFLIRGVAGKRFFVRQLYLYFIHFIVICVLMLSTDRILPGPKIFVDIGVYLDVTDSMIKSKNFTLKLKF